MDGNPFRKYLSVLELAEHHACGSFDGKDPFWSNEPFL